MSDNDKFVMAQTMWGEARGESSLGQEAVAWVIKNRRDDGRYGHGYSGVCKKPYQFSCWNSDDPNLPQMQGLSPASPQIQGMMSTAGRVMRGEGSDPTNGATHYFAPAKIPTPSWAAGKQPCATIGNHKFYNNID